MVVSDNPGQEADNSQLQIVIMAPKAGQNITLPFHNLSKLINNRLNSKK
jgi:hypothetical protein